jgi:hypothetical protein
MGKVEFKMLVLTPVVEGATEPVVCIRFASIPARPRILAALILRALVVAPVPADDVGTTSGKCTLSRDGAVGPVLCPFLVILLGPFLGDDIDGTDGTNDWLGPVWVFGGARPEVMLFDPKMEKSKSSGSMLESLLVLSKKALISFRLLNLLPVGPIMKTS